LNGKICISTYLYAAAEGAMSAVFVVFAVSCGNAQIGAPFLHDPVLWLQTCFSNFNRTFASGVRYIFA